MERRRTKITAAAQHTGNGVHRRLRCTGHTDRSQQEGCLEHFPHVNPPLRVLIHSARTLFFIPGCYLNHARYGVLSPKVEKSGKFFSSAPTVSGTMMGLRTALTDTR
jgi:hypothetical protein